MPQSDFNDFNVTMTTRDNDMKMTLPLDKKTTVENKATKKSRLTEKCVFLCSSVCMVVIAIATLQHQWLLPYVYVTLTPLLIVIRVIMYWRNGWHYFLIDFCYFVNIAWSIFLCIPDKAYVFAVLFSVSNGMLLWAVILFRNSLVYHNIDKVTSIYIHVMPTLLSFVVRWYPAQTSLYWFRDFVPNFIPLSPIWMYLVPFLVFMFHTGLYALIVNGIAPPKNGAVGSYNYMGMEEGEFLYKLFNCCGPGCRCCMYYVWYWVYFLVASVGSLLAYQFYWFHCVLVALLCLSGIWNGGNYYIHVFSVRGFVDEIE